MNPIRAATTSIGALVLSGLFAQLPDALAQEQPASTVVAPSAQRWRGFASDEQGWRIRVTLELRTDAQGAPLAVLDVPDMVSGPTPASTTKLEGDRLEATVYPGWISYAGRFEAQGREFRGEIDNWGEKLRFVLSRDASQFACIDQPRCDARGRPVTTYRYRVPPRLDDGVRTAHARDVGIELAPLEELMRRTLRGEYPNADAVLIARRGRLVFEEYGYGGSRDHLHTLQSATKSITSLLVGAAVDRGEIRSVATPVHEILARHRGHAWIERQYPITLEQVLTMGSNLQWRNLQSGIPISDTDEFRMATSPDIVGYILDRDWNGPNPEPFYYNSGMSILLAAIVAEAGRDDTARLAEQRLFEPLGIRRYKWMRHSSGIPHSGGGLFLRARDLLKIGQLVLDDGTWRGRRVLSPAWIQASAAPHSRGGELEARPKRWAERYGYPAEAWAYGYQWWLIPLPWRGRSVQSVTAWGNGEQWLVIVPELELVVVMLSSDAANASTKRLDRLVNLMLPAVRAP